LTVEEFHRDEGIEEIRDTSRVQLQLRAEFRAGQAAVGQLGEYAELDGGEQDFGRPKGKSGLQDRGRI
jgi:hypothetical protein